MRLKSYYVLYLQLRISLSEILINAGIESASLKAEHLPKISGSGLLATIGNQSELRRLLLQKVLLLFLLDWLMDNA
jgi:hypothetical protein